MTTDVPTEPTSATRIIAIVGSLRADSVNAATARAAAELAPAGMTIEVHPVHDLPMYNGDDELAGPPGPVEALRAAVSAGDGLIFFSPEYNTSFPAVTKNVIDWLSRSPDVWRDLPTTLVVTSPGGRAGLGLRAHFVDVMAHQAVDAIEPFGLGGAVHKFDTDQVLVDDEARRDFAAFLARFAAHAATRR